MKTLREGADELLLGLGVDYGEGDFLEGSLEVFFQRLTEELGDQMTVVAESAATPGAEHERVVAMRLGDGQDLADAGPEDFGDVNEFLG